MSILKTSMMAMLVAAMLVATLPAHAGIVGTEQMVSSEARAAALTRINSVLAGEEVAAQLTAWGVAPDAVAQRVAALSDAELQQLAASMETDPAGGVLAIIGVVFVVLIVLHLTGAFRGFR